MKSSKYCFLLGSICFFYGWLVFTATSPPLPQASAPLLFYSNHCHQDLKLTFCKALESAKNTIDLQMYALTDERIKKIINKKIHEGVKTSIWFDASASGDLETQFPEARRVLCKGLMHRKILTIDDRLVFLGTANLTTSSLQLHDNLVVGLYHPPLADFLKTHHEGSFNFTVGQQSGELWLLPSEEALQRLLQLIQSAKKSIHVALFTLTHQKLITALVDAHERGVRISLAVDFYTGHGASLKALEALQEKGVPILLSRGQQLLHHK